ncbi:TrkA family potassium uptake protein [Streptomyces sp. WMMB 322]|uniref:potassium channel family protein n=1 Tax=Streptomyces sp. WMMB 322 TaxID=1286821 RepID=UPI000823E35D|nr:potassium channel family protein [Streptomyces sp. WMMB 322]SCK16263.1 voltage-gated potassium channel [Streptomyces sp. WMMB 322]
MRTQPDGSDQYRILLPRSEVSPPVQVGRRLLAALLVLMTTVLIVYLGRDGYTDNADDNEVSFLDAVYYTTVTLSTTGYGDIAPASDSARIVNILLVTPLRILFLIILIGTTLEALTDRTREQWRLSRWRSQLRDHTVVVGFGTKGRSAAQTLLSTGVRRDRIVVIDPNHHVAKAANDEGYVSVVGDATRSDVLARAEVRRAKQIVIATQRDDTAVLVTLTARQLNRRLKIVAAVREEENVPLLRQSGADSVITSASAAGRLLGLSVLSPNASSVMEDLIQQGSGLSLTERPVTKAETGRSPRECKELVVTVVRGHRLLAYDDPQTDPLQSTDRLVVIQRAAAPHPSDTGLGSTDPTHSGTPGPGGSESEPGTGGPSGPGSVGFWRGERGGGD